jgi:NADH:ubiquinone oxidoreductase subunit
MKQFLLQFFTWWNGQTLGTRFYTWRKGEHVGTDEFGNRYYRGKGGRTPPLTERRWVIYRGIAEPSKIPAGWHGWIHHRIADPPSGYAAREWEKPHQQNLTGSPAAYRPPGSILRAKPETPGGSDYEPWRP